MAPEVMLPAQARLARCTRHLLEQQACTGLAGGGGAGGGYLFFMRGGGVSVGFYHFLLLGRGVEILHLLKCLHGEAAVSLATEPRAAVGQTCHFYLSWEGGCS